MIKLLLVFDRLSQRPKIRSLSRSRPKVDQSDFASKTANTRPRWKGSSAPKGDQPS